MVPLTRIINNHKGREFASFRHSNAVFYGLQVFLGKNLKEQTIKIFNQTRTKQGKCAYLINYPVWNRSISKDTKSIEKWLAETCMSPFSSSARFADLGAIPGKYVRWSQNSILNAVKAEAREPICFNLCVGSFVGTNGNNLLFFLCNTRGLERFLRFLASRSWKQ